jgi:hypothetical protein
MRRLIQGLLIAALAFMIGLVASFLWRVTWVDSKRMPSAVADPPVQTTPFAPQYCDIHSNVLMYRDVPSEIFPEYRHEADYLEAKERLFPHSNSIKVIGCGNGPPIVQEVTDTCPACRLAEKKWKEARPKRDGE